MTYLELLRRHDLIHRAWLNTPIKSAREARMERAGMRYFCRALAAGKALGLTPEQVHMDVAYPERRNMRMGV